MRKAILGISAYYQDSAAALLVDGQLVAAAQEERFTRKKHDPSFPINACRYVLEEAGIKYSELSSVAFYDKPFLKFERLLETYHALAPEGVASFLMSMPVWIKEKLFTRRLLDESLRELGEGNPPVYYPEHHLSHAASAFYPSPFEDAAILTVDGVGEWATTTIGKGSGSEIEILKELQFPHSLGLLYSAFTYYTGFMVNSGEYKLMGLAPYGDPHSKRTAEFKRKTLVTLIDLRADGSMLLNMDYFQFATGLRMTNDAKWTELFGLPRRPQESDISQEYMDMALAIQQMTEEVVLRLARTARDLTGSRNIVLAGGRGAELRGERQAAAFKDLRQHVDSAGRGRCRWRGRSCLRNLAHSRQAAADPGKVQRRHERLVSGTRVYRQRSPARARCQGCQVPLLRPVR